MINNWLQIIIEIVCIIFSLTFYIYIFSLSEISYQACQNRQRSIKRSFFQLNKILFSGIYYRILQGRIKYYRESYLTRQALLGGLFFCSTSVIVFIPLVERFVARPPGGYFFYGVDPHSLLWILFYLASVPMLVMLLELLSSDRKIVSHGYSLLNRSSIMTLALLFVITAVVIEFKVLSFSKILEYSHSSNQRYLLLKQPLGAFIYLLHILSFYEVYLNANENHRHVKNLEGSLAGFDFLVYRLSLKLYFVLSIMIFIFIFLGGFNSLGLAQMVMGQGGWLVTNVVEYVSLLLKFNVVLATIYFIRWFFYSHKRIMVLDENGGKVVVLAIVNLLITLFLQML